LRASGNLARFSQLEDSGACPTSGTRCRPEYSSQRGLGWCLRALCIEARESKNSQGGNVHIMNVPFLVLERDLPPRIRWRSEAGALDVGSLILAKSSGAEWAVVAALQGRRLQGYTSAQNLHTQYANRARKLQRKMGTLALCLPHCERLWRSLPQVRQEIFRK
jgi:hypothetical protein